MTEVFIQLGIVLGITLIMSLAMKLLKQPLIIGYLLTGLIAGPSVTGIIPEGGALESFSHIGIALLLFIVGLGLRPSVIKEIGRVAVITGLAQIIFTTFIGYFIALALGFNSLVSFYLSLAFALSSTIIVLRLLYNKQEQETLYGRITIGFLLVQDIVAMIFFIVLSASTTIGSGDFASAIFILLGKMALVFLGVYILLRFVIPHVDRIFAENREMLFIFSLGTCFALASIFYKLNFSLELGALAAGVILSVSPYQREIAVRIQSLRDFFLIIFFVVIGANINLADLQGSWTFIIVFSIFILIGNPLILILVMRAMRYTTKTSFFTGLTVAQISEFSLIIIAMGIGFGHLPANILGPSTVIGIITIAASTYFITYNHQIYRFFHRPLHAIFPDINRKKEFEKVDAKYDVIVFGSHRLGGGLVRQMRRMKVRFIVVDHDPDVIRVLNEKKIPCLYGSADDPDLIDALPDKKTKLVISTIPEFDVNMTLLSHVKQFHRHVNVICIANHPSHAEKLYRAGATYVIMPPYLGRRFMVDLFKKNKLDHKKYRQERKKHIFDLPCLDNTKFV